MNWLRRKIEEKEQFYKILAFALITNIALVLLLMMISYCVKDITVSLNGKTAACKTMSGNTTSLLRSWGVSLDENDTIDPGVSEKLRDGSLVSINTYEIVEETVTEETDFKTKESYTSELLEGEKKVTTEGVKGKDKVTYRVAYLGEEEMSREETGRETISKPVTEQIDVGTAVAYNGVKYSRKLTVVSTGYTHTGHRTATGTSPHRGTMAVDRGTIAMGSYGYVPGYGQVHAEDTGGAIKGNRIDLFFETRGQAVSWGRRTVTLYIK